MQIKDKFNSLMKKLNFDPKTTKIILFLLHLIPFIIGYCTKSFNLMMFSIIFIWLINIIDSIKNIEKNIFYLFFLITFFTLLLGKNVIGFFDGTPWYTSYDTNIELITHLLLYISLLALDIGKLFANNYFAKINAKPKNITSNSKLSDYIEKYALLVFFITFIPTIALTVEKIIFVKQNSYLEFYTSFDSVFPSFFEKLSQLNFSSLILFLILFPKFSKVVKILCLYGFYLVLTIFTGSRTDFVVNVLIVLVYLIYSDRKEIYKIFNKKIIAILAVVTVFGISFLSAFNSIRNGYEVENYDMYFQVKQFFIDQSNSLNVIKNAVKFKDDLPSTNVNYTFGPFISYYNYSKVFSLFRKDKRVNECEMNTVDCALYCNNFGQTISYLALGDKYLEGHGLGTQYIAELYVDFGYAAVFVFNLALGILLILFAKVEKSNIILLSYIFILFSKIIYIPRSFALEWVLYLLSIPNLVLICLPKVFEKYFYKNRNEVINEDIMDS